MTAGPTDGGIQVFPQSVGLDGPLPDLDLNPIRGRVVAVVVCRSCGSAVIGKVLTNGPVVWLNCYAPPHSEDYPLRRQKGSARIPAPRIVTTSLLVGSDGAHRKLWCEKHGESEVSRGELHAAAARATTRRPGRLAV